MGFIEHTFRKWLTEALDLVNLQGRPSTLHGVPMLWYMCRNQWYQMVQGCCMALSLTLSVVSLTSLGHLLQMGIDDMKLTAGILSFIFSCFNLATYL